MNANEFVNQWWNIADVVQRLLALLVIVAVPALACLLSVAAAAIDHWRHIA